MKKSLKLFVWALCLGLFTACSSEDPIVPGEELVGKTYTSAEGLTLSVDGNAVVGKTAAFAPGTNGNATITLAGESFNIGEYVGAIPALSSRVANMEVPTSGVLPGSSSVTINVTLVGDATNCTFEGTSETEFCTFTYSGRISDAALDIKLADVKLKNKTLAGTKWNIPKYVFNNDTYEWEGVQNLRVVWESSRGIDLMGSGNPEYETPVSGLIGLMLMMNLVENPTDPTGEKLTLYSIMNVVLKEVSFSEDGNVYAKYMDLKTGNIMQSPAGVATYVVTEDNNLRLFLNPQAIVANTINAAASSCALDLSAVVGSLLEIVAPMVQNGVPVKIGQAVDNMAGTAYEDPNVKSFYLGTETLLPIIKVLGPVIADPEVRQMIIDAASQDPEMGSMASMLEGILKSLPAVIDGTTKIEAGVNLLRAS